MNAPTRLSKRLIEQIGCSRRDAELYIEGGWVTVNGVVIEAPQHPVTDEVIALLPGAQAIEPEPATLLFNAPANLNSHDLTKLLTPTSHWSDDPVQQRVLKGHFLRLKNELPLGFAATGLSVLTQDWRTTRKLQSDAAKLEQEYVVEARGTLTDAHIDKAKRGLLSKGQSFAPCKISWQSEERLRIAVKNPVPHFIQSLTQALGLEIGEIKRIRIGGVSMGKLPVGQWRYLKPNERF